MSDDNGLWLILKRLRMVGPMSRPTKAYYNRHDGAPLKWGHNEVLSAGMGQSRSLLGDPLAGSPSHTKRKIK